MRKTSLWLVIFIFILSGCGRQEVPLKVEEENMKIGLSFDSFVIERWHREQEIFVAKAEALGAKVYVQNANGDVNKQIKQIEYLMEQGIQALVVVPTDSDALTAVIKKALAQGIKVVAYDRLIKNANVSLCVSFDNEKVGQLLTEGLLKEVSSGDNIVVIMGSPVDSNVEMVDATFDRMIQGRNIHILEKVYADNWRGEIAFNTVVSHLEKREPITGIFCGNDDLAQAAIKALSEYRKAGKVCVVGQDADLSACQRIVEGTQNMTVYKDVIKLAKETAEMTVQLIKGEKIEGTQLISDGTYKVPYYAIAPIKVTKENMDEVIIASGFHLKEEVYLNLVTNEE